jgi:hypothetical protein
MQAQLFACPRKFKTEEVKPDVGIFPLGQRWNCTVDNLEKVVTITAI